MIRVAGDRVEVDGAMTLPAASALLEQGKTLLAQGQGIFDLARVTDVDSSALAVVFGWQRAARAAGTKVRIVNAPSDLLSLGELYGVSELLPL